MDTDKFSVATAKPKTFLRLRAFYMDGFGDYNLIKESGESILLRIYCGTNGTSVRRHTVISLMYMQLVRHLYIYLRCIKKIDILVKEPFSSPCITSWETKHREIKSSL